MKRRKVPVIIQYGIVVLGVALTGVFMVLTAPHITNKYQAMLISFVSALGILGSLKIKDYFS